MKQTYKQEILSILNKEGAQLLCEDISEIIRWASTHPDRVSHPQQSSASSGWLSCGGNLSFQGENLNETVNVSEIVNDMKENCRLSHENMNTLVRFLDLFGEDNDSLIDASGYENEIRGILNSFNTRARIFRTAENTIKETGACDIRRLAEAIPGIRKLYEFIQNTRKEERERLYALGKEILDEYQELFAG